MKRASFSQARSCRLRLHTLVQIIQLAPLLQERQRWRLVSMFYNFSSPSLKLCANGLQRVSMPNLPSLVGATTLSINGTQYNVI